MDSGKLLLAVYEHTRSADRIIGRLVMASAEHDEGLPVERVKPELERLLEHLRTAQCAATALQQLAAGNPPPKRGD